MQVLMPSQLEGGYEHDHSHKVYEDLHLMKADLSPYQYKFPHQEI
jgi:hypothetical protein